MNSEIRIRAAVPEDAEKLLAIYAPYVTETAVTFEVAVPSAEEFRSRIKHTEEKYPYLAAVRGGEILGYTYLSGFQERVAYSWSVETSIYVRKEARRQGIGAGLYTALEEAARRMHLTNFNACIAVPAGENSAVDPHLNRSSELFHARLGYRLVGEFHDCAYKFDRWYDMIWMEKSLGNHPVPPEPVLPAREVLPELTGSDGFLKL